jgi:hypothetical protein
MTNPIRVNRVAGLAIVSAALVILAGCADDQHPSAPTRSYSTGRSAAAGDVGLNPQAIGTPNAKPQDQIGFTKVTSYFSGTLIAPAGQTISGSSACPAGSFAVGGGYTLIVAPGALAPVVMSTAPSGLASTPNGWGVVLANDAAGTAQAFFQVYTLCAS